MIYIGIDPGKNGAIVAIHQTRLGRSRVVLAEPMPDSLDGILRALSLAQGLHAPKVRAFLEDVHSMPGQGVVSSFTFGRGLGHLEMALTAYSIDYKMVAPQVWQRVMNCKTAGDKNVTKRLAQKLFPKLTVTHAIADALLIAEYNRRMGR